MTLPRARLPNRRDRIVLEVSRLEKKEASFLDDAKFRQRRIRQLTQGNKSGEAFGFTVPAEMAGDFSKKVLFNVRHDYKGIYFDSGCKREPR